VSSARAVDRLAASRGPWRLALVVGLVGASLAVAPASASAALSASVANLTFSPLEFANNAQTSTGTMTLTATDSGPVPLGWNVTIQASAFVYSGPNSGTNIPASSFTLTAAAAPTLVSGQAISPIFGPRVPTTSPVGTLDVARKVLQCDALGGVGTYGQSLSVSLAIPAQARAGTYTSTLTTTISQGP
jgi:hypothetical protein